MARHSDISASDTWLWSCNWRLSSLNLSTCHQTTLHVFLHLEQRHCTAFPSSIRFALNKKVLFVQDVTREWGCRLCHSRTEAARRECFIAATVTRAPGEAFESHSFLWRGFCCIRSTCPRGDWLTISYRLPENMILKLAQSLSCTHLNHVPFNQAYTSALHDPLD